MMVSPTMSGHASKAMPSIGMPTAAHSECSGAGTKNFSVVSMGIPAVAGVAEGPQSCHGKGPTLCAGAWRKASACHGAILANF